VAEVEYHLELVLSRLKGLSPLRDHHDQNCLYVECQVDKTLIANVVCAATHDAAIW